MAKVTNIQHYRSTQSGSQPNATDMEVGEIALNLADLKMFTKDHNGAIKGIGGEDVAATLDLTVGQGSIANGTSGTDRQYVPPEGTLKGISVTGFKMNFTKANRSATTYNIFNQMMLFSLFQGHFVSKTVYSAHTHSTPQAITWDNHTGETVATGAPS